MPHDERGSTCCVTGLAIPDSLIASHIVPWSIDIKNRLNPMNGLCLNPLHERAFDRGYLTIDQDYRVVVSRSADHELLAKYHGHPIKLPDRFRPAREFLASHRENVFLG